MKVLVADDHALVREGLISALQELKNISTIEAGNADEVIKVIQNDNLIEVVLLDLFMPGADGFRLLQDVCNLKPDIPIVVFSASEEPANMRKALDLGAAGYIPKSSSRDVMLSALKLILSGGIYVPPSMIAGASESRSETTVKENSSDNVVDLAGLTNRQRDVLSLVCDGRSNKEIARLLDVSENTVKIHVAAVLKALGVNNRTKAAMVARELGLI